MDAQYQPLDPIWVSSVDGQHIFPLTLVRPSSVSRLSLVCPSSFSSSRCLVIDSLTSATQTPPTLLPPPLHRPTDAPSRPLHSCITSTVAMPTTILATVVMATYHRAGTTPAPSAGPRGSWGVAPDPTSPTPAAACPSPWRWSPGLRRRQQRRIQPLIIFQTFDPRRRYSPDTLGCLGSRRNAFF